MAIHAFVRANHKIRVPRVRCIQSDGSMLGILNTKDALKMALDQGLDLVEVAPTADPPVCRIMDFGKFQYEESLKRKQARKHAQAHSRPVKEIKFHANVGDHDYQTKVNHARDFLQNGHKVKLSLQFRGRENVHRELGFEVIKRALKDCQDVCVVEMEPKLIGKNLVSMMGARAQKT